MIRIELAGACALALVLAAGDASAIDVELQNDGFVDNAQIGCQTGFVPNDEGAVTFTHDIDYVLKSVRFLFCGATTTQTMTVRIYAEEGTPEPGQVLYEDDYQVTGSVDQFSSIDLASQNLAFSGGDSFRFSLQFHHMDAPGLARDLDNTTTAGVNWVFDTASGNWVEFSTFEEGDWIIRATVETEGAGGGGGAGPATTTTAGVGGGGGAGGVPVEEGSADGCSCRHAGRSGEFSALFALLLAGGMLRRRGG